MGPTEPGLGICPEGLQRAPCSKVGNLAPPRDMGSPRSACVSLLSALLSPEVLTEKGGAMGEHIQMHRTPPSLVGSGAGPRQA